MRSLATSAIRAASSAEITPTTMTASLQSRHACESRVEARQQVNAGIDHRRGVDQRADRGGGFHRVGQPGLERELRGFGGGSDQKPERQHGQNIRRERCRLSPGRR